MDYSGGHSAELNPDDVKTGIDDVLYTRYDRDMQPGYLRATDSFFFKQGSTTGIAHIWDEDSNVGAFRETDEQQDLINDDTIIGNQKTVLSQKFSKQIPVSDEAFKASMHGKRAKIGEQLGDRARLTQDSETIWRTWGDAFDGNYHTVPDGSATAANSHTTLKGFTVDNLETGAMTADNLWTQTVSLAEQKAQDGELGSHMFEGTVVPFTLYKTARETLNSTLVPNSAENQLNIFDSDYGQVTIAASAFLGSTYSKADANASTSYHLVSSNHQMERRTFHGLETFLIPPQYTTNHSYYYRALYHEATFPGTWEGLVSTNGTA